jgi:thioredoxin 1
MSNVADVTDATFEAEVLKSDKPVLVDFFATWCGPCKMLAPTLDKIAAETTNTLKTVKVDVDKSPDLVEKYEIKSMPTLVLIRNGEVISRKIGGDTKANILKWIDDSLHGTAPKVVKRFGNHPRP